MPSIQTRRLGNGVLIAPGTKNSSAAAATGEIFKKTGSAIGLGPCQLRVEPYPIPKGIDSREGKCYLDRRLD